MLQDHPKLFYTDGDTIIQCESTLFRVHSSRLADRSQWFSNFFTPERERKDNILFLSLEAGSDDMAAFLTALYDGLCVPPLSCNATRPQSNLFSLCQRSLPDPVLTVDNCIYFYGVLKTAHRYGAESIKNAVLTRFQATWPAKLEDHMVRVQQVMREGMSTPAGHVFRRVNPAEAIATLRRINFSDPILLAPLFYDLNSATNMSTAPSSLGFMYKCLPFPDIERFIVGNASLAAKHIALSMTPPVLLDVSGHQLTCHAIAHAFWVAAARILLNTENRLAQPIYKWWIIKAEVEGSPKMQVELKKLCEVCRFELLHHVLRCQSSLWASLDECYVLSPATASKKS